MSTVPLNPVPVNAITPEDPATKVSVKVLLELLDVPAVPPTLATTLPAERVIVNVSVYVLPAVTVMADDNALLAVLAVATPAPIDHPDPVVHPVPKQSRYWSLN